MITPEIYGSTVGWVKCNCHFAPSTPFAVSRAACDLHLMSLFKAYGFPVFITRAANVYGPGQQLYQIITKALLCARTGHKLSLHGVRHFIRFSIYIEDVARSRRQLLFICRLESYHRATWQTVSILQLVEQICVLSGVAV